MFTLAKLGELPPKTRMRKIVRILQGLEVELTSGRIPDTAYLRGLVSLLAGRAGREVGGELSRLGELLPVGVTPGGLSDEHRLPLLRGINALRHGLLRVLRAEPAEWDLVSAETGALDRSSIRTLPMVVYLEDIRSPFNVGSLFRTAEAFGAERILLSPRTPLPTHPRAERTSLGASRVVPWEVAPLDTLRGNNTVFALELGGQPIEQFRFPGRGVVLVGSEELGLSPEALEIADQGLGRVGIPLAGAKRSLNVSVAFGILLQAWFTALSAPERTGSS